MQYNESLLDHFASIALNALISKLPLLDTKGEVGQPVTMEEKAQIKKDIARSAYEYASHMMAAREDYQRDVSEKSQQARNILADGGLPTRHEQNESHEK